VLHALERTPRATEKHYRFRDTFAVELLLSGVPIEGVSILLGRQSVRITERHTPRGCARGRNNSKQIWPTLGSKIHSSLCKERYTPGTRRISRRYLIHFTVRILEARVGIEPTHKGFADLSLTTWVPRLNLTIIAKTRLARKRRVPAAARILRLTFS
jgi:hypothetical protein